MKEEQLKKIMKKSSVETSEGFINDLMTSIEASQETQKTSYKKLIWLVSLISSVTISGLILLIMKSNPVENTYLKFISDIPKMPILVIVTLSLLFGINYLIRLNEENSIAA